MVDHPASLTKHQKKIPKKILKKLQKKLKGKGGSPYDYFKEDNNGPV